MEYGEERGEVGAPADQLGLANTNPGPIVGNDPSVCQGVARGKKVCFPATGFDGFHDQVPQFSVLCSRGHTPLGGPAVAKLVLAGRRPRVAALAK
ncbi:hypothetical protein ACQP2F_33365 [Actinoplanes sp. CA-030573]|uniref:hypothetical protein n=1 Tax=Actinoplanes sp. CA-030573 TaxID=3239898 RepID=UPI003D8F4E78